MAAYLPAFMSHAHADNAACDPYYAALTRHGVACYYDRQNPQVGHSLSLALQHELERARALIVMVSPAALASFWVGEEIDMFFALMARDRSRKIIPLRIAPCELPPRLESRWWIDATALTVDAAVEHLVRGLEAASESSAPVSHTVAPAADPAVALVRQMAPQIEASFANEDWPDVIRKTTFLLARAPDAVYPDLYRMRGDALTAENDPSAAREAYEAASRGYDAALAYDPTNVPTLQGAAHIRTTLHCPAEAVPLLEDALTLASSVEQRVAILRDLAWAQAGVGRWELSTKAVAEGRRLAPADSGWDAIPAPAALPRDRLPASLAQLGFTGYKSSKTEFILPPLCSVRAGEFLMGSDSKRDPIANESWAKDEQPQHRVSLPGFQIARYPVTVAEYACFVRSGHAEPQSQYNQLAWKTQLDQRPDHPVVNVSWHDAVAYAAWLAQQTGQPWRLPSEAEWEKAARGADGRIYPWGDSFQWMRCNTREGGKGTTTPVGSYPGGASPCRAQDLAGNVLEWTSSPSRSYPYRPGGFRESPNSAGNRVLRGGSWDGNSWYARAACRLRLDPEDAVDNVGFRVLFAAPGS